jgi:hypothetical protein
MWEPRRLTTLWAFTTCYRDSFTFTYSNISKAVSFFKFFPNKIYLFMSLILKRFWIWKQYVPPKRRYTSTRLHGVASKKTVNFSHFSIRHYIRTGFGAQTYAKFPLRYVDRSMQVMFTTEVWSSRNFTLESSRTLHVVIPRFEDNFVRSVQTSSGAQPASYPKETGAFSSGVKR